MSDRALEALGHALRADLAAWTTQTIGWLALDHLLAADWQPLAATETAAFNQLAATEDWAALAAWLSSGFVPTLTAPTSSTPAAEAESDGSAAHAPWQPQAFEPPLSSPAASGRSGQAGDQPTPSTPLPATPTAASRLSPLSATRRLSTATSLQESGALIAPVVAQPAASAAQSEVDHTSAIPTRPAVDAFVPPPAPEVSAAWPTPASFDPHLPASHSPSVAPSIKGLGELAQWIQSAPAPIAAQALAVEPVVSDGVGASAVAASAVAASVLAALPVLPNRQDPALSVAPSASPSSLALPALELTEQARFIGPDLLAARDHTPASDLVLLAAQATPAAPDRLFSAVPPSRAVLADGDAAAEQDGDPPQLAMPASTPTPPPFAAEFDLPERDTAVFVPDSSLSTPAAVVPQSFSAPVVVAPVLAEIEPPVAIEHRFAAPVAVPVVDVDAVLDALTRALQREYERLYGG